MTAIRRDQIRRLPTEPAGPELYHHGPRSNYFEQFRYSFMEIFDLFTRHLQDTVAPLS